MRPRTADMQRDRSLLLPPKDTAIPFQVTVAIAS